MLDGALPTKEARLLKALGHPVRLMIVSQLIEQECCVGTLWNRLGLNQAETSRHLALLRRVGAVETVRQGRNICYRVSNPITRRLLSALQKPAD
mgnify:FL=1